MIRSISIELQKWHLKWVTLIKSWLMYVICKFKTTTYKVVAPASTWSYRCDLWCFSNHCGCESESTITWTDWPWQNRPKWTIFLPTCGNNKGLTLNRLISLYIHPPAQQSLTATPVLSPPPTVSRSWPPKLSVQSTGERFCGNFENTP